MMRSVVHAVYIVVLVIAISHVLMSTMPLGDHLAWHGAVETRLSQALLVAVAVREVYVGSRSVWRAGHRRLRQWQRARRSKAKAKPSDPELKEQAQHMFPSPPIPDERMWAESLVIEGIKLGVGGLFNMLPNRACAVVFRTVRWPLGPRCIYCGRRKGLKVKDPHYRQYWRRYACPACSEAKGHEVTFTDLSDTIIAGSHLPINYWMWGALLFVSGCSTRELARELEINYKSARRMVSLFQLAYLTQRFKSLIHGPVEIDEVYIVGGLKGRAGGLPLERPPRCRGLKKPGRGTWQTDKTPIIGLVDRQGHAYLIPCANVQTPTIQPFVEHLVDHGATVYTDQYNIYNFLRRLGYTHETVNHSAGEYARGEVHVNTVEGLWSLLRDHLRIHRGVSKVYLPLYVARFEFTFNRRDQRRWGQLIDLLALGCQANGRRLRRLVRTGNLRQACLIPGLVMEEKE